MYNGTYGKWDILVFRLYHGNAFTYSGDRYIPERASKRQAPQAYFISSPFHFQWLKREKRNLQYFPRSVFHVFNNGKQNGLEIKEA